MAATDRTAYPDIPPEIQRHIAWIIRTFECLPDGTSYQRVHSDRGNWTGGPDRLWHARGHQLGRRLPRTCAGWLGVPAEAVTEAMMRAMPFATAVEIGYALFYRAPHLDRLGTFGRPVACLFDWGWGSGPFTAIREAQSLIQVLPDGRIGPRTAEAWLAFIAHHGEDKLTDTLVDARIAFSEADVARHPEQRRFMHLWRERYERFRPGRPLYDD